MNKIFLRNGIRFVNPPDDFAEAVMDVMTFLNPAYASASRFSPYKRISVPQWLNLAETHNSRDAMFLEVCRGFPYEKLPVVHQRRFKALPIADKRLFKPVVFPKPLLTPNKEQKTLLTALETALTKNQRPFGNFLFQASTSTGKTIFQALAAARLGQKTLILCQTNLIRKAWYDDLKALYGWDRKEIGLIQQATWRIGKFVTLTSLATLSRRKERWDEIFNTFGTVVLDEAHILPADQIYQFISRWRGAYILGATATLRTDHRGFILRSTFGKPVATLSAMKDETESSMPITDATVIDTNFHIAMDRENFDFPVLIDALVGDDARNDLIVKNAVKDWREGHSVVVVTSRVAHAHLLVSMLEDMGVDDVNLFTGDVNSQARKSEILINAVIAGKIRMIVSTDQVIAKGANINSLSRMHITMPIKDRLKLEQLAGRMRRKSPLKKDAILRYYRDQRVPYLYSMFKSVAVPVFQRLHIKRWENVFIA